MKKNYQQLNQYDRDRIEAMLNAGYKQVQIANILSRSKATVSREIRRNRRSIRSKWGIKKGAYQSSVANHKAYLRRKYSKYQGQKIRSNSELENYIKCRLKKDWSPDEISGRMKKDKKPFYASKDLIYAWLYSVWGQRYTDRLYSKRDTKKRRRKKKTEKTMIPNRVGIDTRTDSIDNKLDYGHFEADTIVSGKNGTKVKSKESITVIYERKAKYIDARIIKNLKPKVFINSIKNIKSNIPSIESITLDNGMENRDHEKLHKLNIDTYFCDPYSSWQKAGVENANKMIRRYIPKGSDISYYSHQYLAMIVKRINNKPRKSLGYKTPSEVMYENDLLTKKRAKKLSRKVALGG